MTERFIPIADGHQLRVLNRDERRAYKCKCGGRANFELDLGTADGAVWRICRPCLDRIAESKR